MKILEYTGVVLVGLLALVFLIAMPIDAYQFLTEPSDYIAVHHLDIEKEGWRFDYLKGSVLMFLCAATILTCFILSFIYRSNKVFLVLRRGIILMALVTIGINYYLWYLSGFDH